jgi:beta-glucanase (GH16 family)
MSRTIPSRLRAAATAILLLGGACSSDPGPPAGGDGDAGAVVDARPAVDGASGGDPDGGLPLPEVESDLPDTFSRGDEHYELAWVEDFATGLGEATVGDWTFDGNASWFAPANVAVGDGSLLLHLTPRGDAPIGGDRQYLGAEYDRTGSQRFGRYLTRMRPAAPPGVIASFFTAMYQFDGDGNMTETAEIDIEFAGRTDEVEFTIHWIDAGGVKRDSNVQVPLAFDAGAAFHLYEIEWLADRIVYYIDGVEVHRFSDPAMLAELALPQEVMANIWITTSEPWAGAFDAASLPVASTYRWIAAYRLAP